ncbi:MAG TPA: YggS family pyridoxal phosphate-dependent enzyme [Candidatus Binatia bacterium]
MILASASPRRAELLARVAYPFDIVPAAIDERRLPGEDPRVYARRLAAEKARHVSRDARSAWVLGADTIVVRDDEILGKPADDRDAARMLASLSGRSHEVLTAIAWARDGEVVAEAMSTSEVEFRALSDGEIAAYVATGEPRDKAGAYAIQGGAAAFVRRVRGSVTGVIGLPLEELRALAERLALPEPSTPLPADAIALRLRATLGEVAATSVAAGRPAGSVRVVAVSKGHPPEAVAAAIAAGATDLGENYVQEGVAKRAALGDRARDVRWHLIGPLQTNKAAAAARTFDLFHALDRAAIADALVRRRGAPVRGLLQVNVARDPRKAGVAPEDVLRVAQEMSAVPGFELVGLMTIGPLDASEREARATFAALRERFDELRRFGYERLTELSMGMSDDYGAAIAEGATLVRIGTAIFGPRPVRRKEA